MISNTPYAIKRSPTVALDADAVKRDPAEAGTPSATPVQDRFARQVICLAAAYCVIPSLLNLLLGGRLASVDGRSPIAQTSTGTIAQYIILTLAIACCANAVLFGLRKRHDLAWPAIALSVALCAPFVQPYFSGNRQTVSLEFILLVCVVYALGSTEYTVAMYKVLGGLSFTFLAIALVLGFTNAGWMSTASYVGTAEKGILSDRLLAGPLSHSNLLGMATLLIMPFLAFLQKRYNRWLGYAMSATVLALSASRTSIIISIAIIALALLLIIAARTTRRAVFSAAFVVSLVVAFVFPFANTDPSSYSNRGYIWAAAIRAWSESPVFGSGLGAFGDGSYVARAVGYAPSHGHNQLLTMLNVGGLIAVSGWILILVVAARRTRLLPGHAVMPTRIYIVALILLGVIETPLRIEGFGGIAFCSLVPILIIFGTTNATRSAKSNRKHATT